jgi:hypothetical protein
MSQINVNNVLPLSGSFVNLNGIVAKEVVNGPFVLYGGTAFNANTSTGAATTIIGTGAMLNSTGPNNVAIGQSALRVNTTGSGNVAIGPDSLLDNTIGTQNIAIGQLSLANNTTGIHNTAVGHESMINNISGIENVSIGGDSGGSITTGSYNVIVGTASGSLITTGSNNVCLGDDTQTALPTTSNSITLGNGSHNVLRCNVQVITSLSDARDKKDVSPIGLGLEFVKELNPVKFVWDDRNEKGKHDVADSGFIAQDLQALEDKYNAADVLKLVYNENPEKLEASYGRLIPVLVKAIQELTAKVEELENK